MINNPTFRPMRDYWMEVDGYAVHVLYYSPGTNHTIIHGYSTIPNDPEEMEYFVWKDGLEVYDAELSIDEVRAIEDAIRDRENEQDV